jgi:hypothetical protein
MSDRDEPGWANGGMSLGGRTTTVQINRPKLDAYDKAMLCPVICKCEKPPGTGADGRSLKQSCVSNTLRAADKALDHQSPYKPEVNYDMTKSPPAPIMDKGIATKGHDWLPGWLNKYWPKGEDDPPFVAGRGLIRRPDVVIVNDPTKPPTQDNIKQVVEIKFPPDNMSPRQEAAYTKIAGDENKLVALSPRDCDCWDSEPPSAVPVPNAQPLTAGQIILMVLLGAALAL